MWSSMISAMRLLIAPRTDAINCNVCAHPASVSRARSRASTCPRMRRTRLTSLALPRMVWLMAEAYHSVGGYDIGRLEGAPFDRQLPDRPTWQAFRVSICASLPRGVQTMGQRWSTGACRLLSSAESPTMILNVGRFGEIRGALAGRLLQHSQVCSTPSGFACEGLVRHLGATKQCEDHRLADAVGDYAHRDACRGHGLSVENAEVALLGKADCDRSLVPSEPRLGWRGSGPNRRDGPRQRPGLHPGDIRSEMISGWLSIPAPAVRSYRRRDP